MNLNIMIFIPNTHILPVFARLFRAKVRQELQGRVEELKFYPELLSAAEQRLFDCEKSLQRTERKCSEKSTSITQLQVKVCD